MRIKFLIVLCLAFLLVSCGPQNVHTLGCNVNELVTAINDSNATPATTDTINLDPGCIYELGIVDNTIDGNNGLPSITSTIVINGNGATIRRSTGAQKSAIRLFHISPGGRLTLNNATLLDGLGMEPVNIADPIRNAGGAIFNAGELTVNNSLITENRAMRKGGGIYNSGTMTINATTIQNNGVNIENVPNETGGGILNTGTATIIDSTIANNVASQSAGGIGNSGSMTITNTTISGNSTTLSGIVSGAAMINSGSAEISYTTITNNSGMTPGGAVFSAPNTIQISNSIIADNPGGDCSYPATSSIVGPNLDSDGTCTGFTITDDPKLDPLANNGGPTQTHSIAANSPARDAASGSCPGSDQRGEPRPHGSACDLGAYEFTGGGPPPAATDTPTNTPEPTVIPSSVTGFVFIDDNNNGIRDPVDETTGITGAHLTLKEGACPGTSLVSETWSISPIGLYGFGMLMPGTYCILPDPNQQTILPVSQEFTVGNDEHLEDVNFYHPNYYTNLSTDTPTPTTFLTPFASILKLSVCWIGPGSRYDVVSSLQPGTQVELLGTGEGGGYLVVNNPIYGVPCWVEEDGLDTHEVDLSNLPEIKIPPLPTQSPMPPVCTPPPCGDNESYYCEGTCPGGCGTTCATHTPPAVGSVTGLVWKDSNLDGARQRNENGYPGVHVFLGNGSCNDRAMGTRTATTDANGNYTFSKVSPGTYCLYMTIAPTCSTYSIATTSTEYTVVMTAGGTFQYQFGFAILIC